MFGVPASKRCGGGAKVVGNLIFYSEEQLDPGLQYIELLIDTYQSSGANVPELAAQLGEARAALDTDAILAASVGEAGSASKRSRTEAQAAASTT